MKVWISNHRGQVQLHGPTQRPSFEPFGDPAQASSGAMERLRHVVRRTPQTLAAIDSQGSFTFLALWNATIAVAREIERRDPGVHPVGILLSGDRFYLVALLACIAAGRVAVLLDSTFPAARNLSMVANSGVRLLLQRRGSKLAGPCLEYLDPVESIDSALASTGEIMSPLGQRLELDQPAVVLATSGSSSTPKLIAHSQRTLWHWARTAHDSMQITSDDRVLSLSSSASLGGITALFGIPLAGASLQFFDLKTSGISGLFRCLVEQPVTILRGAPSFFRSLTTLPESRGALAKLRCVHTYGEPLMRADFQELREILPRNCFIRTSYGSTECSGLNWFAEAMHDHDDFRVAAGVLMPDTEALIENDGRACEPGEVGELVIRSRYNALGEWQLGTLQSGRLAPDPFDPSYRIYRTGDLARYTEEEVFVVLGRQDRMVKINGQRVEPAEIEAVLRRIPDVAEFEIVPSMRDGRTVLAACLVATDKAKAGWAEATRAQLYSALPPYMVPRIVVLDRLPRLPGGKVDLTSLRVAVEQ